MIWKSSHTRITHHMYKLYWKTQSQTVLLPCSPWMHDHGTRSWCQQCIHRSPTPVDSQVHHWWTKHKNGDLYQKYGYYQWTRRTGGHPESPWLWEQHISIILHKLVLGFKNSMHDMNIYHRYINWKKVLFLQHVDDFEVAYKDENIWK